MGHVSDPRTKCVGRLGEVGLCQSNASRLYCGLHPDFAPIAPLVDLLCPPTWSQGANVGQHMPPHPSPAAPDCGRGLVCPISTPSAALHTLFSTLHIPKRRCVTAVYAGDIDVLYWADTCQVATVPLTVGYRRDRQAYHLVWTEMHPHSQNITQIHPETQTGAEVLSCVACTGR